MAVGQFSLNGKIAVITGGGSGMLWKGNDQSCFCQAKELTRHLPCICLPGSFSRGQNHHCGPAINSSGRRVYQLFKWCNFRQMWCNSMGWVAKLEQAIWREVWQHTRRICCWCRCIWTGMYMATPAQSKSLVHSSVEDIVFFPLLDSCRCRGYNHPAKKIFLLFI